MIHDFDAMKASSIEIPITGATDGDRPLILGWETGDGGGVGNVLWGVSVEDGEEHTATSSAEDGVGEVVIRVAFMGDANKVRVRRLAHDARDTFPGIARLLSVTAG